MSLVNDALKRAKDAQRKGNAPAPGPQLRPAEPAPAQKRGGGIWIAGITAFAAIMALSFFWRGRRETYPVHAAVPPKNAAPMAAVPETKPPGQQVTTPAAAPASQVVVAQKSAPAPAVSAPEPPLKLKAIFYTPGHSTAIINGKTVKAGDVYKGFRVAAITQTSATLVSATQTNVMTLEPD